MNEHPLFQSVYPHVLAKEMKWPRCRFKRMNNDGGIGFRCQQRIVPGICPDVSETAAPQDQAGKDRCVLKVPGALPEQLLRNEAGFVGRHSEYDIPVAHPKHAIRPQPERSKGCKEFVEVPEYSVDNWTIVYDLVKFPFYHLSKHYGSDFGLWA